MVFLRRYLTLLGLLASLVACGSNGVTLIDGYPVITILGFVRTSEGAVVGAQVDVRVSILPCADSALTFHRRTTTTEIGRYEAPLNHIGPQKYTGCFEVAASPRPGSGLPRLVRVEDVDFVVPLQGTVYRMDLVYPN